MTFISTGKIKTFFTIPILMLLVLPSLAGAFTIEQLNVEPAGDIVMEPGKQEVFVDSGETVVREIRVTSRIQGNTEFTVSIEDLVGSDDPEQTVVLLGDAVGPYSIRDFVTPEITSFSLGLGERITIPIEIQIPEDAEPAGHYGAVVVSTAPQERSGGTGVSVVSRLGSILLIRVNGEVLEEGNLEEFRISGPKKFFYNEAPDTFEILFRNSGNVHLTPYGIISIKDLIGREVARIPVNAYFSLPQSLRSAEVSWNNPGLLFGRFSAELTLNRGYDNLTDNEKLAFWVLPWKLIVLIILLIVLIRALMVFISKRFEIRRVGK